jgi:hypothetical protein
LGGARRRERGAVKTEIVARLVGCFEEIEVVAVRGEGEVTVGGRGGRDDAGIAAGGNIAQPKSFLPVLVLGAEDELAVGRNGGLLRIACIGYLGDGKVLEGRFAAAMDEGVDAVARHRKQSEDNNGADREADAMLAHYDRDGR